MTTRSFAILALVGSLGMLCACSSPGTSGLPNAPQADPPQANAAATVGALVPDTAPTLPPIVFANPAATNGAPGRFAPKRADSSTGGNGQTVDGIACQKSMVENQFHIHSYVGVLVNGQWYATPDAIGMFQPGPLIKGYVNAATCFYSIHTHDRSGVIHQEAASSVPPSGSLFTLQNVMDVWGQTLTGNGFSRWSGLVRTFVATTALRNQYTSGFTEFTGDPNTISLYSHEAIFIEVGPPYVEAANLPTIRFTTEY